MGWIAHAIDAEKQSTAFQKAADTVLQKTGTVDALLSEGAIQKSCAVMLAQATDEPVYSDEPWSPEKVKALAKSAQWNFPYEESDASAYWSARFFLETCAELNVGIRFGW